MSEDKLTPKHLSEYEEAKGRFERNTPNTSNVADKSSLNEVVRKLCSGDEAIDIGSDSNLFYELIFHADFIQIKNEFVETFYTLLWQVFIMTDIVIDIIDNLGKMEDIRHIRCSIAQGFFKTCQLMVSLDHETITLEYSPAKTWQDVNLSEIKTCRICPSAFKVLFSNKKFNTHHLNFIMRILHVDSLILSGCNLNGRNFDTFFNGLKLQKLDISECGTSVNKIIKENGLTAWTTLKELNISNNPLLPSTLKYLALLPLKNLNIDNCLTISGPSVWCNSRFKIQDIDCEIGRESIDMLWDAGVLKESIEVLNVGHTHLTDDNLKTISKFHLKELDLTECSDSFLKKLVFPKTLEILKIKGQRMRHVEDFQSIFQLSLKKLELTLYRPILQINHKDFEEAPLSKSLKDLYVEFELVDYGFLSLISKFELERFSCDINVSGFVINRFFNDHLEQRRHLKALTLLGSLSLTNELIQGIQNLNLEELTITAPNNRGEFSKLISSENLQKNIVKLELLKEIEIENSALIQLKKFQKLEKLSFSFNSDVDINNFTDVVKMKTLKHLDLEAVVEGQFNIKMAKMLCIAPVKTLKIVCDDENSMSDDAFQFLTSDQNFLKISKELKDLVMKCVTDTKLAQVLKHVHWEKIILGDCSEEKSGLSLLFSNDAIIYTLDDLILSYVEFNWNDIAKLHLSKFEVDGSDPPLDQDALEVWVRDAEYLRYLLLKRISDRKRDLYQVRYF